MMSSSFPHLLAVVLVVAAALALLVLFVAALVSITRDTRATPTEKLVWILIALLLPVLGPIVWFVLGRRMAGNGLASGGR
jgi:hypothetical protein